MNLTEKEPTVVRVIRTPITSFVNDPDPAVHIHVDGYMSSGFPQPLTLFIHTPGEVVVADDELIGLTSAQARALAESRGTIRRPD